MLCCVCTVQTYICTVPDIWSTWTRRESTTIHIPASWRTHYSQWLLPAWLGAYIAYHESGVGAGRPTLKWCSTMRRVGPALSKCTERGSRGDLDSGPCHSQANHHAWNAKELQRGSCQPCYSECSSLDAMRRCLSISECPVSYKYQSRQVICLKPAQ